MSMIARHDRTPLLTPRRAAPALALIVTLCLGAPAALAQAAPPSDHGCTEPLEACTQVRVAHLLEQSRAFASAAAMKPPARRSRYDKAAIDDFDTWLRARSAEANALAQRGQQATRPEMQMSFSMQYLQLQARLQDESRRFTLISNIMKTKHDTARNSIGNIR